MTISCTTKVSIDKSAKGVWRENSELKKEAVNIDVSNVHKVIEKWVKGKDGFEPDKNDPKKLYRKVNKTIDALIIVQQSLLSQSPDFVRIAPTCYKYEKSLLKVYYQEKIQGDILAETTITFTMDETPEIYTLIFKKE